MKDNYKDIDKTILDIETMKQECEKQLPRDQECTMVFIAPDESVVKRSH